MNAKAKNPEEMQELRDLYRAEVIGFKSPQDCFVSLLASRGPGKLLEAIDFLIEGVGVDLQSPSPSREPAELRRIELDLQCAKVLKTVYDKGSDLLSRLTKEFGVKPLLNAEQLTGRIMDMTKTPFTSKESVAAFLDDCGIRDVTARQDFCREFQKLVRDLSPRLFASEQGRIDIVGAVQELMDDLIAEMEGL